MLRRKKTKKTDVTQAPVPREEFLPVVVEQGKKKHPILRGAWVIVLLLFGASVWGYLTYTSVNFYNSEFDDKPTVIRRHIPHQIDPNALAVVDGEEVMMQDIKDMMVDMPQLAELPMETVYPNLLNMLVNNKVVMRGAEKAGVSKRPEIKRLLQRAEEQIIGQTYLNELLEANVSEEELKSLYDKEIKNFQREEEVHAKHILVKTEKEAKDLLVQLKAGADFATLADQKSLDKNTAGGDLGYFTKGMMVPEFGDAVFDLKVGQYSAPIHTAFGWHIAYVEDKRLANPPSFEDVRDQIKQAVMESKLPSVLANERAKLNVQIFKPTLK